MYILIVLIIILVLLLIVSAVTYYCYREVFFVDKSKISDPHILLEGKQYEEKKPQILPLVETAIKIPYKDVYITSFDGYRLHGTYYEINPDAPVEIQFHGYRSIAIRDFCGGLQIGLKAGHNVLLVDQRAHGKSEGKCLTFGIKERYDCLEWTKFIRKQNGENVKIILVGVSMGAATILMASELNLPVNTVGIFADSGYTSPKEIICKVIRDRHLPAKLVYPFVKLAAKIFGKFDLEECGSDTALKSAKIPVLFVHGTADYFVPCEMSDINFGACASDKTLVKIENAGHGLGYLVDSEKYLNALNAFFEKIL